LSGLLLSSIEYSSNLAKPITNAVYLKWVAFNDFRDSLKPKPMWNRINCLSEW